MKVLASMVLLVLGICGGGGAWAVDPTELPDPVLQKRYRALTEELRCMQCQNQSIADSPVGLAGDLRREVRDMLLAGRTDQEIRDFMSERYGDFILFRPRYSWQNAWLWLTPLLLLIVGLTIAARIIAQRRRLLATENDSDVS